jgi:hypothetical protein
MLSAQNEQERFRPPVHQHSRIPAPVVRLFWAGHHFSIGAPCFAFNGSTIDRAREFEEAQGELYAACGLSLPTAFHNLKLFQNEP